MTIPFSIQSHRDLLAKAYRELDELRSAVASQDEQRVGDALYNFSVTAYHVKDWLIKQPGATYTKEDVEKYIKNNQPLSICRDLCNSNKHKTITYMPETEATTVSATSAVLSINAIIQMVRHATTKRPFKIKIITSDGKRLEAIQVGEEALRAWETFFVKHGV